jgi:GntR family phosphonate transport system transcriptional regulator
MTLIRKNGDALWHQVEQALAADIAAGTLVVGTKLPTEPALMARFGVSRFTVRQASCAPSRAAEPSCIRRC